MTADELVDDIYTVCFSYDEETDGPHFRLAHDQWWYLSVECPHGTWRGESRGPVDITTAFRSVLTKMRNEHPYGT